MHKNNNKLKKLTKLSNFFGIIWLITIGVFVLLIFLSSRYPHQTNITGPLIALDIIIGCIAFVLGLATGLPTLLHQKPKTKSSQTTNKNIVIEINRNTLLTIIISIALLTLAYNYGKASSNTTLPKTYTTPSNQTPQTQPPTNTQKSINPKPTKQTASHTSTPTRKVPITLTDPLIAGTYYCYEDKVNIISNTQTTLNNLLQALDTCSTTLKYKIEWCFNDCQKEGKTNCDCPSGKECGDKYSKKIEETRKLLIQQKNQYCP